MSDTFIATNQLQLIIKKPIRNPRIGLLNVGDEGLEPPTPSV